MANNRSYENSDIIDEIIVLRSVYGKTCKYKIQPCIDPLTRRYPEHVKSVDSHGDIILTEKERIEESNGTKHYIRQTDVFEIEDGTTFDLKDVYQKAIWEAIKNCSLIAKSRTEKDSKGNFKIDGTVNNHGATARYGTAELYIDRPGKAAENRVTRRELLHNAIGFILDDERGYEGRLIKAKLLGRDMKNAPDTDVKDFLMQYAEKDPKKIIALYTGDDIKVRMLFIDAKERRVIVYKDKMYLYGDSMIAATDEAVITWMKQSRNKKIVDLITRDTYPDLYSDEDDSKSKK